jgi:hypothetical protein
MSHPTKQNKNLTLRYPLAFAVKATASPARSLSRDSLPNYHPQPSVKFSALWLRPRREVERAAGDRLIDGSMDADHRGHGGLRTPILAADDEVCTSKAGLLLVCCSLPSARACIDPIEEAQSRATPDSGGTEGMASG